MPVELYLRSLKEKEFNSNEDKKMCVLTSLSWNPSNIQAFKDSLTRMKPDKVRTWDKYDRLLYE